MSISEREDGLLAAYGENQKRIAELVDQLAGAHKYTSDLTKERTKLAAQLEIARKALEEIRTRMTCAQFESTMDVLGVAITQLSDPAAALAEHDKRVAEKCINLAQSTDSSRSGYTFNVAIKAIRREFGLADGSDQSEVTWPPK